MREIKFRGKRLDNGEWVDGFVLFKQDKSEAVIAKLTDTESVCENVDPATVGQFTGLLDKHGKEIYEGDVVYIAGWGNTEMIFPFTDLYDSLAHTEYGSDIENVIGNIHDNPELLKP